MFWFFSNKKRVDEIKEDTKKSFDSVKRDIGAVGGWIKHLNSERELQKKEIDEIKQDLSSIKEEIDGIKNVLSIINQIKPNNQLKINKQMFNKQSSVFAVQTGVQTGVQTPNLNQFSVTERAIIWVLLNSEIKLSYEDLSAILGKEKTTIRGQLNSIKQKSGGLIEENIEKNGKKRLFIPDNIKEKLLKMSKVRVNLIKKNQKNKE
jgi:hypothetical protein